MHIRDDDGRGTSDDIEIEADDETVDEDDHEVRVEVCLSERAEGDIEIEWETRDGTADEGDDYEDDHGTLRIDE